MSAQGWGNCVRLEGRGWEVTASVLRVSFWVDENGPALVVVVVTPAL